LSQTASTPRRRRGFRAGRLSGYVVVLLALVLVGGLYAVAAPRTEAVETGDQSLAVEEGRQLYLQGCSSCHGLNAQGGTQGPSLIGVGAASVDYQVGTGRMPLARPRVQAERKPPRYTQAEIDQMAAYVASLAPGPAVPDVDPSRGDLAQGGELFRLNCTSCHNFIGSGGALSNGKYAPDLGESNARTIATAMRVGPGSMPVFGASTLTDDEIDSIARYVLHVQENRSEGGQDLGVYGPLAEGLVAWVVGISAMVAFTIWIGARA
jgi:ubiquinol-cytochrome c reductase cytochrome c subunit